MDINFISVIIPIYNSENFLKELFDSLNKQSISASKYEIIFIDNNSKDDYRIYK